MIENTTTKFCKRRSTGLPVKKGCLPGKGKCSATVISMAEHWATEMIAALLTQIQHLWEWTLKLLIEMLEQKNDSFLVTDRCHPDAFQCFFFENILKIFYGLQNINGYFICWTTTTQKTKAQRCEKYKNSSVKRKVKITVYKILKVILVLITHLNVLLGLRFE